jgi:hypothetical protein
MSDYRRRLSGVLTDKEDGGSKLPGKGATDIPVYTVLYIARRRCPFCVSVYWRRTHVNVKSRFLYMKYTDTPAHRCVCTELDKQQCVTKHIRV